MNIYENASRQTVIGEVNFRAGEANISWKTDTGVTYDKSIPIHIFDGILISGDGRAKPEPKGSLEAERRLILEYFGEVGLAPEGDETLSDMVSRVLAKYIEMEGELHLTEGVPSVKEEELKVELDKKDKLIVNLKCVVDGFRKKESRSKRRADIVEAMLRGVLDEVRD